MATLQAAQPSKPPESMDLASGMAPALYVASPSGRAVRQQEVSMGRYLGWALGLGFALAIGAAPASAQTHFDVGIFGPNIGVHVGVGRPVYVPPPVYYRAPIYRAPVYRAPYRPIYRDYGYPVYREVYR